MQSADENGSDTKPVAPRPTVPTPISTAVLAVGAPEVMMWRSGRTGTAAAVTTPGAVRVLAWLLGVMLIGVGGNALVPNLGLWWYVLGLALMTVVAAWWIRRRIRRRS